MATKKKIKKATKTNKTGSKAPKKAAKVSKKVTKAPKKPAKKVMKVSKKTAKKVMKKTEKTGKASRKAADKKTKTTTEKVVSNKISIEESLFDLQTRFDTVERKLDALMSAVAGISRIINTERNPNFKTRSSEVRRVPVTQGHNSRERVMHKVICAECRTKCEVPFVPKANRPVYCKTCFSKRVGKN